jgi:hypothetical protein
MADSLATYLHDHLAGATFGIEVLQFLRDEHRGKPLCGEAAALLPEIEEDKKVLESLIERTGSSVPVLKEATLWLGEKVSELKLRRGALGTFEALELLALGILGKLALWRALGAISETESRVSGVDFEQLARRAQSQHSRVEELRLQAARAAFGAAKE